MFTPDRPLQTSCSYRCALIVERNKTSERHEKEATRIARIINKERKENLKTLREWLDDAQKEFNKFIRLRDKAAPCISCNRHHQGQYHAGHYRTTAAASQLRFNEDNCHKQCAPCNNHKSGNITEYRINLVKKIGQADVEALENNNKTKRYTKEEANEIKLKYRKKWQDLEKKLSLGY